MGEGEGGMSWERSIDIYPPPCVAWIASGKLLYSTGSSARCSVGTQMGGTGVGGKEAKEGGDVCVFVFIYIYIYIYHTAVQQKPRQDCKAIILQ